MNTQDGFSEAITKWARWFIYFSLFFIPLLFLNDGFIMSFEAIKILWISCAALILILLLIFQSFKKLIYFQNPGPITIVLGLFGLFTFISYQLSGSLYGSAWGNSHDPAGSTFSLMIMIVFAISIRSFISDEHSLKTALHALLASSIVISAIGILEHFFDYYLILLSPTNEMSRRAISTLGLAPAFGAYTGIMALMSAVFFMLSLQSKKLYFLVFLFNCFALMASGSRTPIYGFVIFLIVTLGALYLKTKNLPFEKFFQKTLALVLTTILALTTNLVGKTTDLEMKSNSSQVGLGWDVRLEFWKAGLKMVRDHPFFGVGPDNFSNSFQLYAEASHNVFETWNYVVSKAHSEPIHILATQGSIGFLLYLLLLFFVARHLYRSFSSPQENLLTLGIGIGFFYLIATNLTAFNVSITQLISFLFPLLLAPALVTAGPTQNFFNAKMRVFLGLLFLVLCVPISGYFLESLSNYEAYKAEKFISQKKMIEAYNAITDAINYAPQRPSHYCQRARITMQTYILKNVEGIQLNSETTRNTFASIDQDLTACEKLEPLQFETIKTISQFYTVFSIIRPEQAKRGIPFLEKSIEMAPNNPVVYTNSAEFYRNLKQFDKAKAFLERALFLKPNYHSALIQAVQLNYDLNQPADNISLIKQLIVKGETLKSDVYFRQITPEFGASLLQVVRQRQDSAAEGLVLDFIKIMSVAKKNN